MIGMLLLAAGPLSSPPGTMLGGAPSSRPVGLGCRPSLAAVVSRCVVAFADGAVDALFVRYQSCPSFGRGQEPV